MLRIGLTGGIGSGKSTVAELFARRGVPIIDADEIARRLTLPGQPGHQPIIDRFGQGILGDGQTIDRRKLRSLVFSDANERKQLEAILHPLVRRTIQEEVQQLDAAYCIISVPLLIEANLTGIVDRVLVIDVDTQQQIQRVMARNGMTEREVKQILASQATRAERLRHADDCIVNNTDLGQLENAVEQLHHAYLALAADPKAG
jgi:dephospho-CoA kinase